MIVAEIGCNHNGKKELARQMICKAKECGVDAVKFQTFQAAALISRFAPKADYQKAVVNTTDSQLEMTRKLELPKDDFLELKQCAESLGLQVFSTPFDLDSIDFLFSNGQAIWKIPSGEVTNLPYLQKVGSLQCRDKQIFLSTGMASMQEIKICIDNLVSAGTQKDRITILHCNTEYPTCDKDVNVLAINDLKENFKECPIGFSDHSVGFVAAIGAAALGVSVIEKHFTLDKNMEGPDHKASATPEELKQLCEGVRRMEVMMGNGKKIVTDSERKNKVAARKSIVAVRDIKKGEIFSEENITCKRPGNGISPMEWYHILGKAAEKDFIQDELIIVNGYQWQGK